MVALIVLLLILALFGGLGFAAHFLWFILIAALVIEVGRASGRIGEVGGVEEEGFRSRRIDGHGSPPANRRL